MSAHPLAPAPAPMSVRLPCGAPSIVSIARRVSSDTVTPRRFASCRSRASRSSGSLTVVLCMYASILPVGRSSIPTLPNFQLPCSNDIEPRCRPWGQPGHDPKAGHPSQGAVRKASRITGSSECCAGSRPATASTSSASDSSAFASAERITLRPSTTSTSTGLFDSTSSKRE